MTNFMVSSTTLVFMLPENLAKQPSLHLPISYPYIGHSSVPATITIHSPILLLQPFCFSHVSPLCPCRPSSALQLEWCFNSPVDHIPVLLPTFPGLQLSKPSPYKVHRLPPSSTVVPFANFTPSFTSFLCLTFLNLYLKAIFVKIGTHDHTMYNTSKWAFCFSLLFILQCLIVTRYILCLSWVYMTKYNIPCCLTTLYLFLHLFIHLFIYCVYKHTHVPQHMCGCQTTTFGVSFLYPPCGPGDQSEVIRLVSKCSYLLRHLIMVYIYGGEFPIEDVPTWLAAVKVFFLFVDILSCYVLLSYRIREHCPCSLLTRALMPSDGLYILHFI